ncbi:sigma-E factor regulatory protein RseB domain-containing protein [Neobacillus sp.]|uniref:sigma-E factor regulatory protein RseB domain-containing protein n=1 Tax=Neobacillus sp. TaxID=2675273 RepID=UPI002898E789|nr:sigma-E factor regulatory protein RseB domain-containing protein [Neobacillus sp.]
MENKLENLKEKMDDTILRDVYFDDKQYQKVLNSIKKSKFQKQVSTLKNKFNSLLSISVVSIMFLGITYFVGTQLNLFNGPEAQQANEQKENKQESLNKPLNQKTAYIPPKQEEKYDEMTKEEILTKMINTVDYFETARGEYKIHYSFNPGYEIVEYAISLKHEPGGYGKRTLDTGEISSQEFYKDGILWSLNESSKTYMESRVLEGSQQRGTTLTLDQAFSTAFDGKPLTNHRERPPFGTANETLFPYEIASNYTRDLSKWEIEKQNEELLGHNTLVIKGTKNHRDFQSFRFWVDKDTGILVKYETYNANGDIVDYLHPTKLEVNVPIDSKKFTPNLEGYKNNNMLRQEGPMMTTGNIDELIPEELKGQWEEAKKKTNETTVLELNGNWYIYVKKGYLVNYIEVNGKEGTLYLAKTSAQKSQHNFHAIAEGYKVDSLKIVYE